MIRKQLFCYTAGSTRFSTLNHDTIRMEDPPSQGHLVTPRYASMVDVRSEPVDWLVSHSRVSEEDPGIAKVGVGSQLRADLLAEPRILRLQQIDGRGSLRRTPDGMR